jgi:hypothetical protein
MFIYLPCIFDVSVFHDEDTPPYLFRLVMADKSTGACGGHRERTAWENQPPWKNPCYRGLTGLNGALDLVALEE